MAGSGWPEKVNLDGNAASHRGLRLLGEEDARWYSVNVRARRYLNNIVEQDHRAIKRRCAPMLGLKSFATAAVTLSGVELAHRIRKRQFTIPYSIPSFPFAPAQTAYATRRRSLCAEGLLWPQPLPPGHAEGRPVLAVPLSIPGPRESARTGLLSRGTPLKAHGPDTRQHGGCLSRASIQLIGERPCAKFLPGSCNRPHLRRLPGCCPGLPTMRRESPEAAADPAILAAYSGERAFRNGWGRKRLTMHVYTCSVRAMESGNLGTQSFKYMQIHRDKRETAIMSIHITRRISAALPIATAALFIQIGSAAAASPQVDFQQQVRDVLTGSTAAHAILHSDADPANAVRSNSDAQQFAQQLLLGWSVSHLGRIPAMKPKLQAEASDSTQKPRADEDFQSTVRQSLLGESASTRGAL